MEDITIVVDVMGGDLGPNEVINGCVSAAEAAPGANLVLLGPQDLLEEQLQQIRHPANIGIEHAPDVIRMDDEPAWAVRNKGEATVVVGSKMIKQGRAQAIVTPGNTGAAMAAALLLIGRIKGISRPAIIAKFPMRKRDVYVLDVGANAECKAENLLEFAIMANSYLSSVEKIENPSIGLLSIGEEKTKGNDLVKEAYLLLERSTLNFYGNVEGKDVPRATTDIVVCDGFTGNIVLKLSESLVFEVFAEIKSLAAHSIMGKLGGIFLRPALRNMKERLDVEEYGGTLLLGVQGVCIICHGSSSSKAIRNAVLRAISVVEGGVVAKIKEDLKGKACMNA